MNTQKIQKLSDEYFLVTHADETWEMIHGDRISRIQSADQLKG
jgi:hypothetical protein